jgi:hypothetical protein
MAAGSHFPDPFTVKARDASTQIANAPPTHNDHDRAYRP